MKTNPKKGVETFERAFEVLNGKKISPAIRRNLPSINEAWDRLSEIKSRLKTGETSTNKFRKFKPKFPFKKSNRVRLPVKRGSD
jgi:hypothetical protein